MWLIAMACVWCAGIGFAGGLWVALCSTEHKLTEQPPEPGFHGVVRLRSIDVRPVSRN